MRTKPTRLFFLAYIFTVLSATGISASVAGGFLGIQMEDSKEGIAVLRVVEKGPAHAAGMKAGDIVTEMGGEAVATSKELSLMLRAASPKDKIKFKFLRAREQKEIVVELGERPKAPAKPKGLTNVKAPEIEIKQWHNLPKGKKQLKLADFKDKTVFLYCFQSW